MAARLFVGNLPYEVTESDLREFFSPVGTLTNVIIPMDRETGKPRGFAFVEFSDQGQADEAGRQLNNKLLKGRNVAINEARARDSSPSSGARPRVPSLRSGLTSRNAASGIDSGAMNGERQGRSERRNRNFGADAKPSRKKKQRHGSRGDSGGRRGPIRERSGGQFFGNVDDDDDYEDDADYKRRW